MVGFPQALREGYRSFLGERFHKERTRFEELAASGQKPRIMLIGCCDSRVPPEVIFDCSPGELFVVRNVANLVPPYAPNDDYHGTSAALEFAVMGLRIEHIVVMGHARCGGVRSYVEGEVDPYTRPLSPGDFIGRWMKLIAPAVEKIGDPMQATPDYVEKLAHQSVENSLENLMTFPYVRTLVERDMLSLHGAYFDVTSGLLTLRDPASGQFIPAVDSLPDRVNLFSCT